MVKMGKICLILAILIGIFGAINLTNGDQDQGAICLLITLPLFFGAWWFPHGGKCPLCKKPHHAKKQLEKHQVSQYYKTEKSNEREETYVYFVFEVTYQCLECDGIYTRREEEKKRVD